MQNIYVVHLSKKDTACLFDFVGVYSSKELADQVGTAAVEMYSNSYHTVTIKALDDIINNT